MRIKLLILGGLLLLLSGCAKPLPQDKLNYVGLWQGDTISLLILPEGRVEYKRVQDDSSVTVKGPISEFKGNSFSVGIGYLSTDFEVSTPPNLNGDKWQMVVDGVTLTRMQLIK